MIQEIRDQGGVDETMVRKSDNFMMSFNAQFFIKPITSVPLKLGRY